MTKFSNLDFFLYLDLNFDFFLQKNRDLAVLLIYLSSTLLIASTIFDNAHSTKG